MKSEASGKDRLMDAALKLGAEKRSLTSVGLRELAREAGLNPNTFYRHFDGIDGLAAAIMEKLGREVRENLRHLRRTAQPGDIHVSTVKYVFEYARKNPDAIVVAVRELHGASEVARKALRELIAALASDMSEDVKALGLFPMLDDATLAEVSTLVVTQLFYMCLEAIEQPRMRSQVVERAVRFVEMMFMGAVVRSAGGGVTPGLPGVGS